MARALVTGGTGFIGSNIALRLVERHWDVVRILERPGASRELLEGGPFEFVTGDALTPETLPPAMQGIDSSFTRQGSWTIGSRVWNACTRSMWMGHAM